MSGTIELDLDGRSVVVRFPYDKFLVEEVKALPGRRWDPARKLWKFPAENLEVLVTALMKHGFVMDSSISAILAGTASIAPKPAEADGRTKKTPEGVSEPSPSKESSDAAAPLTIEALNTRVRDAIARAFPERVRVIGEIANFDKNRERKHLFFSLVEKEGNGGKIKANVDVALFERTAQRLLPMLERAGLTMRDGIEILVEAKVDLYPSSGRYQLIVEDIRPEFTLGQMAISREQILAELRKAGVDRRNLELPVPVPSMRIAVLSSPDSDGWNDFVHELRAAGVGFRVDVFPVRVQGEELRPTMLRGLRWFADRAEQFDILCIIRGGGSRTDLAWFDDREVAFAVANHPLKVIVGIGHERDRSVLDEIAASVKTPTAAAAFLVELWRTNLDELEANARALATAARDALQSARETLATSAQTLHRTVNLRLAGEQHRLATTAARLVRGSGVMLRDSRRGLSELAQRIRLGAGTGLRTAGSRIERATELLAARSRYRLERAARTLDSQATRQRLLDPRRVLARGYSMLRDPLTMQVITCAARIPANRQITILLRDGELDARVDGIRALPPRP